MKPLLIPFALFACSQAQAHSGHDHSHWLSDSIHLLTFIAIASVIAAAYKLIKNRSSKKMEGK